MECRKPLTFRLHACLSLIAAFAFLGVDGYHTGWNATMPGSHGDYFGNAPNINWTHGWPLQFCVRSSCYPVALGPGKPNPKISYGPVALYSRWPIDNAPVKAFHLSAFLVDLAVLACLVAGVWLGLGKIPLFPVRFSTRSMLLLTLIAALVSARAVALRVPVTEPRYFFQVAAYTVVLAGALISLFYVAKLCLLRLIPSLVARKFEQPSNESG
ncbi:hypothetical protein K227x_01370 [Rubripirellula lacrimiformis]|uniref:Uncharacterized protein n=1 Tax=Rubripirellula lacrimiformis TaxID=1930273 RepID=A0A517N3P9_9BACT|nr:hypothetical protein K227x_01370 [Rubripirellula lacrimiformis]